jgi:hypothetical protein
VVRVGSPAAPLAVIPHLLGFMPEASIVVIGLTPPRDRVRVTLPHDLPDPDLVADIAGHAVGDISSQQLTAAIAVGYGPEPLVIPVVAMVFVIRDTQRAISARHSASSTRSSEPCRMLATPCSPSSMCPMTGRDCRSAAKRPRELAFGSLTNGP